MPHQVQNNIALGYTTGLPHTKLLSSSECLSLTLPPSEETPRPTRPLFEDPNRSFIHVNGSDFQKGEPHSGVMEDPDC